MDKDKVLSFVEKILELRKQFDFSVTSWIRSAERNHDVGGKTNSKHLLGLGLDTVLEKAENKESFFTAIKNLGLRFLDEGDHIHIQE